MDASRNKPIKSRPILDLVDLLEQLLQPSSFAVIDHWEADLEAIGFAHTRHPNRLVYVSTFGKKTGRYYYECEPHGKVTGCQASAEDVSLEDIVMVLQRHIAARAQRPQEEGATGRRDQRGHEGKTKGEGQGSIRQDR